MTTTTNTRCTTDDLEWAIVWLGTYEGDREGWEGLQRAAEFIGRELRDRLVRQVESDWKRKNLGPDERLTMHGADVLREKALEIVEEQVAEILRAGNSVNGSLRERVA